MAIVFHESTRAVGGVSGNSNIKSIMWLYNTHNTTQLIAAKAAQVTVSCTLNLSSLHRSEYAVW
jgi:hypothetical protein